MPRWLSQTAEAASNRRTRPATLSGSWMHLTCQRQHGLIFSRLRDEASTDPERNGAYAADAHQIQRDRPCCSRPGEQARADGRAEPSNQTGSNVVADRNAAVSHTRLEQFGHVSRKHGIEGAGAEQGHADRRGDAFESTEANEDEERERTTDGHQGSEQRDRLAAEPVRQQREDWNDDQCKGRTDQHRVKDGLSRDTDGLDRVGYHEPRLGGAPDGRAPDATRAG